MVKKLTYYKNFNIKKNHQKSIILIGNFDGVHLGHQKLFDRAKKHKKKENLKIGVVTFDPIPKMFFNKKLKNYRISNLNQKLNIFKKFKVDFVINKKFDKKFSKIKCNKFISEIIYKKLNPKIIFVSNNFKFGNKREGDVKLLKLLEKKYNYKIINPPTLKKKNKIISSSLIRKLLIDGKLNLANNYLNRSWSIEGVVKKGRNMGKKIGFPTCNIDIENYVIARPGVYAVKVNILNNKKILKGIANLGYRPTFNQKKILLEVNIFNFSGNLYNKKLTVEFIKFIRGEKKFKGMDQLKKQIKLDLKSAKRT
ncbi:MAG: bifunctional riboflavin kinase/FAD synthetase [Candidatus Pelagibacter sp.]